MESRDDGGRLGHNASMASDQIEVVVIGGGPAGSAAARLLAQWGHGVLLVTGPTGGRSLGESLPPSCYKLFDLLDARAAIDAAGFLPSSGNTVRWAGGETRAATFAEGAIGLQIERVRFDAVLRQLAGDAGAQVETDARVRDVRLPRSGGPPDQESPSVEYVTGAGETRQIDAPFLLDCSGRTGVIARRGYRVDDTGRTTLALTAVWTSESGWTDDHPSHTLVETYGDGWAWSVPVAPDRRYATVMVDPAVTDLGSARGLEERYGRELEKTVALRQMLAGATRRTAPWGRDASGYHAEAYGGPGFLLVGDAASFIDPLSSYGVKKALASAWLAAVVAHTTLTNRSMAAVALELFSERERAMHAAALVQSAHFFTEAARHHLHPFWTGRAGDDPADRVDIGADADVSNLRDDPAVLGAFEQLRQAASLQLRRGTAVRVEARPALTTREVVLQDRLVLPAWPADGRGIRFLRDVDLVQLVDLATAHRQVPDLFDAYNRTAPPVALPDFLGALSVLLAKGALVWDR